MVDQRPSRRHSAAEACHPPKQDNAGTWNWKFLNVSLYYTISVTVWFGGVYKSRQYQIKGTPVHSTACIALGIALLQLKLKLISYCILVLPRVEVRGEHKQLLQYHKVLLWITAMEYCYLLDHSWAARTRSSAGTPARCGEMGKYGASAAGRRKPSCGLGTHHHHHGWGGALC